METGVSLSLGGVMWKGIVFGLLSEGAEKISFLVYPGGPGSFPLPPSPASPASPPTPTEPALVLRFVWGMGGILSI